MSFPLLYLTTLIAGCGYATVRGGSPERWGAAILLMGTVFSNLEMLLFGHAFRRTETGLLAIDSLVGLAFVLLALKANRFWPLWVAMFQIDAVFTHVVMFSKATPPFSYGLALEMFALPLPTLIGFGTIRHRLRVRRFGADTAWS